MSSDHDSSMPSSQTLAARLERETGVRAADCYQCAKCTAGCPALGEMDRAPSEIMRMVQMELPDYEERALSSLGIWLCLGCDACATRCPKNVQLPAAMDFLRRESVEKRLVHPDARDILAFHRAFLGSIESHGRLYEVGLIASYKLKTGHLFDDLTLGPAMLFKGKLGILPHSVKDRGAVAAIFARARALNAATSATGESEVANKKGSES